MGVTRSGTEYACVQGWGLFDRADANPMLRDSDAEMRAMKAKGITAVKVLLNEQCWLGQGLVPELRQIDFSWTDRTIHEVTGAAYRTAMLDYIRRLEHYGFTVLVTLTWSAPPGELAANQAPLPNSAYSIPFWSSVSKELRNDPKVMFVLSNEPHAEDWDCWRDGCRMPGGWQATGMQQLIQVIRSTGARQTIIAPGLAYANDLTGWVEHAPVDPLDKLAAGFNVYDFNDCVDPVCWNATILPVLEAGYPVVNTEFGENRCATGFAGRWLDWARPHRISHIAWGWNVWGEITCENGESKVLITDYDGTLTDFGRTLVAAIRRG